MGEMLAHSGYALFDIPDNFDLELDAPWLRRKLWHLQEYCCAYCAGPTVLPSRSYRINSPHLATLDHIRAISREGWDSPENLLMCCYDCNQKKKSQSLAIFIRKRIKSLPLERLLQLLRITEALTQHFYRLHNENRRFADSNPYLGGNVLAAIQMERARIGREQGVIFSGTLRAPLPELLPPPVQIQVRPIPEPVQEIPQPVQSRRSKGKRLLLALKEHVQKIFRLRKNK
jgi:hypothetical protein